MRASDWPGLARISPFEETIDDLTSAFDHILEVRASGWLRQPRLVDESIWCPRFPSLAEVTTRVVTSVGTSFLQFLHSFGRWVGRWEIWCPRSIFPLRAALWTIFDIFKCHMTMLHSCRLLQIIVLGSTDTRVRHLRITFKLPCASLAPGIDYRKVLDI